MRRRPVNTENTLIAITSYPDPKHGIKNLNAVAWHAQKTLKPLSKNYNVLVLAEEIAGKKNQEQENHITVSRIWKKNSLLSLFQLLIAVLKLDRAKRVLIQFEFGMFGGILPVLVLPVLIAIMKLFRKHVFIEIHEVITDISLLDEHVNVHNKLFQKFINLGFEYFFRTVGFLADAVIVFEEELKERLNKLVDKDKIAVLSLGIAPKKTLAKSQAKKSLGFESKDFVVLVFGFVNWYKGTDWLVKAFSSQNKRNFRLVIAGGASPTLKSKKHYQRFYKRLVSTIKKDKNITLTGFVPDSKVGLYFSSADLVVLPYRVLMAGSGPLSLALSYKKPFILSKNLEDYSKSIDFGNSMIKAGVEKDELFFAFENKDFAGILGRVKKDKKLYKRLQKFSSLLAQDRAQTRINDYYRALLAAAPFQNPTLSLYSKFQPVAYEKNN